MSDVKQLVIEAEAAIQQVQDINALDEVRVHYLGKKGVLTQYLKKLGGLSAEQRPIIGKEVNAAKQALQTLISQRQQNFKLVAMEEKLLGETIDVTLPGRGLGQGTVHPITRTFERVVSIFKQLGFSVKEGPEIEDDYHNFQALNIPELHPARAMQDTFYFDDGSVLRTHTSPVQIRTMENETPPLRVIAPGRVYRCDYDMTHTPMFHQLEGLVVDEVVSFVDLKSLLINFLQDFFEAKMPVRFRASYFPFTEPSAEVDMGCIHCDGKGCRVCSHTGWLEILGCGMVHPNVFSSVGIDSEKYTGFAFGVGLDRLTMLRYGVDDIRLFFENDLDFLKQF